MIRQLTEKDEEEEQKRKRQRERKEKAEIRLKEAELKQAKKARRTSKKPTKRKKVCCTILRFLKDRVIFCNRKLKLN